MIDRLVAFVLAMIGVVAAWVAIKRLKDEEVAERIDKAREVAQGRNAKAWEAIELEVGTINEEIEAVDDRSELARLLDE